MIIVMTVSMRSPLTRSQGSGIRSQRSKSEHPLPLTLPFSSGVDINGAGAAADAGDRMPHVGVRLEIAQVVIIHDPQSTVAKSLRNSQGDLGLRLNDMGPVLLDLGPHFLLKGDGQGAAFLRLGLGDAQ